MSEFKKVCQRADQLLARLERLFPAEQVITDWDSASAFRWHKPGNTGYLKPVTHPHQITLDTLIGIDDQKRRIDQNTRQFVNGFSANNVLLTGARGTGKSSLIKALLSKYANLGMRIIEVEK